MEAMLLGMPIIASRRGGIMECITDNETGLLVDNTPEAFQGAIKGLIDSEGEKTKLGRNARMFAERRFNPDRNIVEYEAIFNNILGGRFS